LLNSSATRNEGWSAAIVNSLGIIAGNGIFPIEVARAARRRGCRVVAVAHINETEPLLEREVDSLTWIKVGELQRIIDVFKQGGVEEVAMAGGIARSRLATSFAPDTRAIAMLSRIGRFSDDAVLRGVAAEIEREGIPVIDPVPMLEGVLAQRGLLAGDTPTARHLNDLEVAFRVIKAIGDFDIGQTIAVREGVVAAVEAVEGTDAALRRAASLSGKGIVVAKGAKPSQDLRFDRPAIGPDTIELLAEIGAAMIGVEAGTAMILERDRTLKLADDLGIRVYGHQ
jgi:UDP-2,3-diacylglucosamine hydrolase